MSPSEPVRGSTKPCFHQHPWSASCGRHRHRKTFMMHRSLVILSSSPPRPDNVATSPAIVSMPNSLSPDPPSLSSFPVSRPKAGSRAVQLRNNVVIGFQLASALPRAERDLEDIVQIDQREDVKKPRRTASKRSRTKASVVDNPPLINIDATRAHLAVAQLESESVPPSRPRSKPSKPRAQRALEEETSNEQEVIQKKRGRPKKHVAENGEEAAQKPKKSTRTVSTHFPAPGGENGLKEVAPIDLTLENDSVLLHKRKLNWTPPRETLGTKNHGRQSFAYPRGDKSLGKC